MSTSTLTRGITGVGLVAALLLTVACDKQKLIPRTKIPDTKGNRELIKVVASYRDAMVRKGAAKILTMIHPTYQDDAGTPDPADDVDFVKLKQVLRSRFKRATRVRFRIEFQRIQVRGREAVIDTWIDATFVYKHPNYRPHYKRLADYNRYRLLQEDGKWRFIGGI